MDRITRLFVFVAVVFSMLLVGATALPTAAQEGTPASADDGYPLRVDPALCTVAPRDPEALLDIWFPESGTPAAMAPPAQGASEVTIPLGEPLAADETIVVGITLTVQEVLACFAAGDFPRATALFTDDLVASFGPGPGETREDVTGFLEASPVPEAGAGSVELLAVTNVMLLEDGRVGAFVVDRQGSGETPVSGTVFVVFEQGSDRWLVDEVIEFPLAEDGEV